MSECTCLERLERVLIDEWDADKPDPVTPTVLGLLNMVRAAKNAAPLADQITSAPSQEGAGSAGGVADPFNCPKCGAHDFGLYAMVNAGECIHCNRAELVRLRAIEKAAKDVCYYDWSDNDDDAVASIDSLRLLVE